MAPPGLPKPTTTSREGEEAASYGAKPSNPAADASHFHFVPSLDE
jgi:hypothetical protein